jgi:hypothetical protein
VPGQLGPLFRSNEASQMKRTSTKLVGCLLLFAATSVVAGSQIRWGAATQGLQLATAPVRETWTVGEDPEFHVSFRNSGTDDVFLNLGVILGGRRHYPMAVSLLLAEPGGRQLEYRLSGPSFVAGRMDDYVVPLRTRAIHELTLTLSEFHGLKLPKGRYQVSARFQGRGATITNSGQDWTGWNFWQGTLESRVAEFEIRDSK